MQVQAQQEVVQENLPLKQYYVDVGQEDFKLDTLRDLLEALNANERRSVIFVNSRAKICYTQL